jgi:hypothetical protein
LGEQKERDYILYIVDRTGVIRHEFVGAGQDSEVLARLDATERKRETGPVP